MKAVNAAAGSAVCVVREPKPPLQMTATAGAGRMAQWPGQARRNTSVPLVPPKPKLFFTATSIFIVRASFAQ